jgi:hypothetical protein
MMIDRIMVLVFVATGLAALTLCGCLQGCGGGGSDEDPAQDCADHQGVFAGHTMDAPDGSIYMEFICGDGTRFYVHRKLEK